MERVYIQDGQRVYADNVHFTVKDGKLVMEDNGLEYAELFTFVEHEEALNGSVLVDVSRDENGNLYYNKEDLTSNLIPIESIIEKIEMSLL
jgi:hypothetical protein